VPELLVLGFDLSGVAIDFEARRIRITGHGSEGPFAGCAIIKLAVSLAARKGGSLNDYLWIGVGRSGHSIY